MFETFHTNVGKVELKVKSTIIQSKHLILFLLIFENLSDKLHYSIYYKLMHFLQILGHFIPWLILVVSTHTIPTGSFKSDCV